MRTIFSDKAWEDYLSWQEEDKALLKKINSLIKDIKRTPHSGLGKPEPLKHELGGYWSRRINQTHRLVYKVLGDDVMVASCRFHYDQ